MRRRTFLDIRQKKLGHKPSFFREHFASQTGPNLPGIHGLTQQNLCHFVAFIAFKINHWLCSANERIRAYPGPQNNGFVSFGLRCSSFPVRAEIWYTTAPGLSTESLHSAPSGCRPTAFLFALKLPVSHSINQRNRLAAVIKGSLHPGNIAILGEQFHRVDLPGTVWPYVLRQPQGPGRPLDILPNRLSGLWPSCPRALKGPHIPGLIFDITQQRLR